MILDSSAIVAIILREPGYEALAEKLDRARLAGERLAVGAPTLVEAHIVLTHRIQRDAAQVLSAFLTAVQLFVVPFSDAHAREGHRAFIAFGKGLQRPGKLNFGDCLSYAVAISENDALLFTGADFLQTDISVA